jgi:hypothetical protein
MAILESQPVNAGDPVTSDIINKLVSDLNLLNKATTSTFSLSLASAGEKQGAAAVSQKVYSDVFKVTIDPATASSGATWTFPKDTFKSAPRCWVQPRSSATLTPAQLNFTVIIVSVTAKSMTFRVRGPGTKNGAQAKATIEFDCFAVEV